MSLYDELFDSGLVFDVHGDDAELTPAEGGSVVTTRAIVAYDAEIRDSYGTVIEVAIAVTLPRSDVGFPKKGATVAVSGKTFRVDRLVTYDELTVRVSCSHG